MIAAQKAELILTVVRKWVADKKPPVSIQIVETPPELFSSIKQLDHLSIINDALHRSWDIVDKSITQLVCRVIEYYTEPEQT